MYAPKQPEFLERIAQMTGFTPAFKDQDHKQYAPSCQDGRLYQVRMACPYVSTLMAYDTVKQDWTFHSGPPCDKKANFNALFMGHLPPEVSTELSTFPPVIFEDTHANIAHGPFKREQTLGPSKNKKQ